MPIRPNYRIQGRVGMAVTLTSDAGVSVPWIEYCTAILDIDN